MNLILILTVKSKNKKSHNIMFNCFHNNFMFQKKLTFKKTRTSKITLLKSPHIHKKAQRHFEQKLYKTNIVFILKISVVFLLLKKLIDLIFVDNFINYTFIYNTKIFYLFVFWFFNFSFNSYTFNCLIKILKLIDYTKFRSNRLKTFKFFLKMTYLLGKSVILNYKLA